MNRRTRRRSRRQMGRGRTKGKAPKRKGPEISATECNIGEIREGNDGNMWKVKKVKNGVKRWIRYPAADKWEKKYVRSKKKYVPPGPSASVIKKAVKDLMKACQKAEDDNGPDGINAMGNRFNCDTNISPKMQTALDGDNAKQANRALKEVRARTAAYKRAVKTGDTDYNFAFDIF